MAEPISIFGWNTRPDTSGNAFFEDYSIKATNDQWKYNVAIYNKSTTRVGIYGAFRVPAAYSTASTKADILVEWTAAATSTTGNVEWDFDYRAVGGNDTESLDQSGTQESLNVADANPSAIHERLTATLSMTTSNLAAGDLVQFGLFRDGTDAGNTSTSPAIVHGAFFDYST